MKKWLKAIFIILGIFLMISGCQQLIGKDTEEVNKEFTKEVDKQESIKQEVTKTYKEIARFEGTGTKSTESFKVNSDKVKIVAKIGGSIIGSVAYISLGSEDDKYFVLLNTFTITASGEEGAGGETIVRNLKQGYYYIDIKTGVGWEAIVYEYI